jgi:hypothetical protein
VSAIGPRSADARAWRAATSAGAARSPIVSNRDLPRSCDRALDLELASLLGHLPVAQARVGPRGMAMLAASLAAANEASGLC